MISFKWKHFPKELILLLVRWYLAYSLSYRDIEEIMLERNIQIDHSTINRWVIHYAPLLESEFRKNYKRSVGSSWRMDETYIKIKGIWHYLYHAVDKNGNTVDFMLSKKRDEAAAKKFFERAIRFNGLPEKITIDKSGANKAGFEAINLYLAFIFLLGYPFVQIQIRQIKYLNNIIEQDHRSIKRIVNAMMGFKSFNSTNAPIAGIGLYQMLKKGQHVNTKNSSAFLISFMH